MKDLRIEEDGPLNVEEYNGLREMVGWRAIKGERALKDLTNTWYNVVVRNSAGELVAMSRIIGNGGYFYTLVDVIVHPAYQRRGIGQAMLERIVNRMEREAGDEDPVALALISAKGRELFYAKAGFQILPDDSLGAGLLRWFEK